MTKLEKLLEEVGLTKNEITLFNHLYHSGPDTASNMSLVLSINRATSYHALHMLVSKGLILSETKNGSKVFRVTEKNIFSEYFDYQKEKLIKHRNELEEYMDRHPPRVTKNTVSTEIYTGDDGIRMALEKAFKCRSKKWSVIAPKRNFFTEANEEFANYYLAKRKKYTIHARTLWEMPTTKNTETPSIKKIVAEDRDPRYLPKDAPTFNSIIILYDTSLLFISSYKERTATLIHSESIHSLMNMQFEVLYSFSIKPKIRQ